MRRPDGNLWFTDFGFTPAIGRINPSTGQIKEFSTGINPGSDLTLIAPGPDGNMWFTDRGTKPAIGRITMSGAIKEYSAGLLAGSSPWALAPGPDGNVWFTDEGTTPAIGRISPSGSITESTSGLASSFPTGIAPGPDGNLWFGDENGSVGRIGSGAPTALQAPPDLSGPGRAGSPEACQGHWSPWAGVSPSSTLDGFDGYVWLRDGVAIASGQTYTPTTAEIGHQLTCHVTVTYPVPFLVTTSATTTSLTVLPPTPAVSPATPVVSALRISPPRFALTGRRVGHRCEPVTSSNRTRPTCKRSLKLVVTYALNASASVTFRIERELAGRFVKGRCEAPTRSNRPDRRCTRVVALSGTITSAGTSGPNRITFIGKIVGHKLVPGTYLLLATPSAPGASGVTKSAVLRIRP